jgi:putative ABC transport system ATP-binding protein
VSIIELKAVSKKFRNGNTELSILEECDYAFQEKRYYSIIGRSGLGKTTLLRILGTIECPDKGDVVINNQSLANANNNDLSKLRRQHMGFVFQNYCLIDRYSVFENLELPLFFNGVTDRETRLEKIKDSLSKVQLSEDKLQQCVSTLSGGEKQRLSIARALINNPQVIYADEPTGNLDIKNEQIVMDIFREVNQELGKTIVIVTHNQAIARQADTVLTLDEGKIVELESFA